jgi:hypothetical protein
MERFNLSLSIRYRDIPARRHRARKVNKGAVLRNAVMGSSCRVWICSHETRYNWSGAAGRSECLWLTA